jgi:hypothetical protein
MSYGEKVTSCRQQCDTASSMRLCTRDADCRELAQAVCQADAACRSGFRCLPPSGAPVNEAPAWLKVCTQVER